METLHKVIRLSELPNYCGLQRTQIEQLISQGSFPKPVKLSTRRKAWLERDLIRWQLSKIAERDQVGISPFKPTRLPRIWMAKFAASRGFQETYDAEHSSAYEWPFPFPDGADVVMQTGLKPTLSSVEFARHVMEAYGFWAEKYVERQWDGYLLTFLFKPLSGRTETVLRQMKDELDRFYSTFVTRVERKPCSKAAEGRLPLLFCFPDLPVLKRKSKGKNSIRHVTVNDGLHWHGVLLVPPFSRLREGAVKHFRRNEQIYVGPQSRMIKLDVEPITTRPDYVVTYAFKSVFRGRCGSDEILIFPKSQSEMS